MRVIALCHLKGGVGKTTGAVNLAYEAAQAGYRVLCWDLDPQGAATWYLGCEPDGPHGKRLVNTRQALSGSVSATAWPNLDCAAAHHTLRNLDVRLDRAGGQRVKILRRLLKPVAGRYDAVFVDCPPGLSRLAEAVFRTADTLLMPVIPSHLSLRAYDEVVRELDRLGIYRRSLYPYFSLVDRRRAIHRQWLAQPPESMVNVLQSWVPAAVDNERMGEHRAPVNAFAPRSRAARAWRALWQELEFRLHMSPPAHTAEGTG
ncbi:AAA family ATPase [Aquisalimonas lutea]|uniref:ParA family protein n=1 Tax=Aquisalimonas lutea TaxID=1327750 RepID=UPI0025B61B68|nr:AAA family ATPase [Aquisalimonas lutea]MDN3516382.1 AAA family ATPase [Aquisalimonas lutea]